MQKLYETGNEKNVFPQLVLSLKLFALQSIKTVIVILVYEKKCSGVILTSLESLREPAYNQYLPRSPSTLSLKSKGY